MCEIFYSTDKEWYGYSEIEEAINGADVGIITIYQGEAVPVKASDFIPLISESLSDRAYDDFGEYSDMWPRATKEQNDELDDLIGKAVTEWADKYNLQPTFFRITNTKELKINIFDEKGNWEIVE